MRYLRFLLQWALRSYLHSDQEDERIDDDDDGDGDGDDDDGGGGGGDDDEVDATLWLSDGACMRCSCELAHELGATRWLSVGAYIHAHVNLHMK